MSRRAFASVIVTVALVGIGALVLVSADTPPSERASIDPTTTSAAEAWATTDSTMAIVAEDVGDAVEILPEGTPLPDKGSALKSPDSDALVEVESDETEKSDPGSTVPEEKEGGEEDTESDAQARAVSVEETSAATADSGGGSATRNDPLDDKESGPLDPDPLDSGSSADGPTYTWRDGDRTLRVTLQPELILGDDGAIARRDNRATGSGDSGNAARAPGSGGGGLAGGLPVFRSESGALMALPGGVTLSLDPEWTPTRTDAFFTANKIDPDRVSELGWLTNGFFIETEPGFPSLRLANKLAGQDGVEFSIPNWWTEKTTK